MQYRKKLIEVALPLKAINEASAREKSIRHGHPSTLHLWWARRPLAACRAVLFASLVDDPDSDPAYRRADGTVDEERAGIKRAELFNLIEELVRWENSNDPRVINAARAEIARCVASRKIELGELQKGEIVFGEKKGQKHAKGPLSGEGITAWEVVLMHARPEVVNAFLAEHAPPVLDPFCGGGSIPLEAQRLGLRAYASDLNPVPVLITKALIEIPPKFAGQPPVNPDWQKQSKEQRASTVWQGARGLAEDVRYYGQWMRDEAKKRIGHLYPKVKVTAEMAKDRPELNQYIGEELTVIAWLWARTVASPNPAFQGVHVPLVNGFWLSKKSAKLAWIEPETDRTAKTYHFKVRSGKPTAEQSKAIDQGTKAGRATFRCLFSGDAISGEFIDEKANTGGLDRQLMAVVAEGNRARVYLDPSPEHTRLAGGALAFLNEAKVPREPARGTFAGNAQGRIYGFNTFGDYFTARQLVALTTFSDLVQQGRANVLADSQAAGLPDDDRPLAACGFGPRAYADAVTTYLGMIVSRYANYCSTICVWSSHAKDELAKQVFLRQGIPMTWDYAETNPFASSGGTIDSQVAWLTRAIPMTHDPLPGHAQQVDAAVALPECERPIISTDPPYYDNVGYADLSDYFYVWLRRTLSSSHPSLFSTVLTPKRQELIASPYRHDGSKKEAQAFFEKGLEMAFRRMRDAQNEDIPLTIFYAFKQAETEEHSDLTLERSATASTGWETILEGIVRSGFGISGTWPIRTELIGNLKKLVAALASSIVLVCRPRPTDAPLATRKDFMNALRRELPEALKNLQHGNIAPVDLAQAAIGPGMAVFTRFAKVMETDGSPMSVRAALGIINQVLDEVLAEQEGDFDPDTRWALAWFEQFGIGEGPFGVAETLSKAKNTAINGLVEAGVVKARAGKVQLLGRANLPDGWDPAADRRLTVWETTQHLIRTLETKGESEAAALLNNLGGIAEVSRELAYRLFSICERKKWAEEALAYNGLVIAWPELSKLAMAARSRTKETQREIF